MEGFPDFHIFFTIGMGGGGVGGEGGGRDTI